MEMTGSSSLEILNQNKILKYQYFQNKSYSVIGSEVEAYENIPGFCKSANLSDIRANDYVLTPGRYVGVADEEDDGIHFEDKMSELTATLKSQLEQAKELDQAILENLKVLGYE